MGAITHNGEVLQGLPGIASQVNYDNSDSGLSATQVQDAIDEVNAKLGTASTKDVPVSGNASTSQVVMGNDTRLSDARPASDVSAWAKANSKPSYNASEVGAEPNGGTSTGNKTFNVGGKLQLRTDSEGGNITLSAPNGKHHMEMDINDNNNLRMYFWDVDNQTVSGAITKSVSGFANLDDIVSKVNRFRDSFSNDSAVVPLSGSTHLNDITTTCFVNGAGTANGYPTDDWYFVVTFIHYNPVYRTQVAFSMTGANYINRTYIRMCQSSVWSSWGQIPTMSVSGSTLNITL